MCTCRQEQLIESAKAQRDESIRICEMKKSIEKQEERMEKQQEIIDEIENSIAQLLVMYETAWSHFPFIFQLLSKGIYITILNYMP